MASPSMAVIGARLKTMFKRTQRQSMKLFLARGLLSVSLLVAGSCTDKSANNKLPGNDNVGVRSQLSLAAAEFDVDYFILRVTASDMEPLEDTLEFDGQYITGSVEVPSGRDRRFELTAEDTLFTFDNRGADTTIVVIYRGVTVIDVLPDRVIELTINMRPAVPMIRISPLVTQVEGGSVFNVELRAFNLPDVREIYVAIDFSFLVHNPVATLTLLETVWPSTLPSTARRSSFLPGESSVYEIRVTDTAGFPIVDSRGDQHLATIPIATDAFLDKDRSFPLAFTNVRVLDKDSAVIPDAQLYRERSEVQLSHIPNEIISFPDPVLDDAVRSTISLPDGNIRLSNVLHLTSFDIVELEVADLTGINNLRNLRLLAMDYTGVSDLSPLIGLNSLSWLNAGGAGGITDLSPLLELPALEFVDLHFNGLTDLSSLAGQNTINWLDIQGNNVTDLAPIGTMDRLVSFFAQRNQITSIEGLRAAEHLGFLNLNENLISDISPLAGHLELFDLRLQDNNITDIFPLVENARNGGLGKGDFVFLSRNPLDNQSVDSYIPELRNTWQVTVDFLGP